MYEPLSALLIGLTILVIVGYILWPRTGLLARWRKQALRTNRILLEDALKHLYDCEYRKIDCTLESIAGALSISGDDGARLISRLESLNLIGRKHQGLRLTSEGRSYALRIVRVHRLWERYFADETDMSEYDWHKEAERREHFMSGEEIERLSKYLGNPLYDPHGDPIPTSMGNVPGPQGIALTSLDVGDVATIVHIEDEPSMIYAQLVAQDLSPGLILQVIERTREKIAFEVNGKEVVLAPVIAANVTVVPLGLTPQQGRPHETLAMLNPGQQATVVGIAPACKGLQRRRLMDLGLVPGVHVTAELQSVVGDPIAYRIRETLIALRRQQANDVWIERREGD